MPQDNDTRRAARAAIGDGIRLLNARHWRWSLTYDDITFVLNTYGYSLPRDVKKPIKLELQNSSGDPNGRLEFKDPSTFIAESWPATSAGTPRYYSIMGYNEFGEMTLDVKPAQAFITKHPTGRFWYLRKVQIPVMASDVVNVPDEFELFVELYAREHVAGIYAPGKHDTAREDRMLLWQQLIRDESKHLDWNENHG